MTDTGNGNTEEEMNFPKPIAPLFGDDLRIDEEDDENLEMLPEIERELILSERFQMLQRYKDEKALYDKYTRKADTLSPKAGKRARSSSSLSSSSSYSSNFSDDSSYTSSDDDIEGVTKSTSVEAIAASLQSRLSLSEALKLQVSRDLLQGSFQHVPADLRTATLLDCFVRVPNGAGNYVVCKVVGCVDTGRSSFDLQVQVPSNESMNVPIGSVSNSAFTDQELSVWASNVSKEILDQTARTVGSKYAEIRRIREFVWDDSMVNRMVEEKKKSRATGVKLTLEIAKLRNRLHAALHDQSVNTAAIQEEIAKLEKEYRETQKIFENANSHQFGIVAINHRNRMQQHEQDFAAAKKRKHHADHNNKELNPFKRRECKPVVMWDVGKRSPRKEVVEETVVVEEQKEAKKQLSDLIDFQTLLDSVGRTCKQRIQAGWSASPAPLWEAQLLGTNVGEVMSFQEWKRRVDEEE